MQIIQILFKQIDVGKVLVGELEHKLTTFNRTSCVDEGYKIGILDGRPIK